MDDRKVYSTDSVAMAWHVCNVLEQHDIPALVKNANLYSVAGELPINECWPEVWVKNRLDSRRARQIISALAGSGEDPGEPWQCSNCAEENEGNFAICWNCQSPRDPAD